MHDLVNKTSVHNEYLLSLHNKNKNVMGWNSSHKLTFYLFKHGYKPFMNLVF